ncbi:MAG: hypothetical protein AABY75_05315 [Bacteroidota bacterium]
MIPTIHQLWTRASNHPIATGMVVLLIALLVFAMLPITLSWNVSVPCRVIPGREWMLVRNGTGGVLAVVNDFVQGSVQEYTIVNVVRGDAFRFDLSSSFSPGDVVRAGDTVVTIHSYELVRELHRLSGELAVARASLDAVQSGEKESIEEEAQRVLLLARERERMLGLIAVRQDSLHRRNFVSLEVYELARSEAAVASMEAGTAEARLQVVRTGAKPEQIRLIRSQIAEREAEIGALKDQLATMTMVAPFAGVFFSSPGTDTLCAVEDTSRAILIQIPMRYLGSVAPGQSVTLRAPRMPAALAGMVRRVDPRVRFSVGAQVVQATAVLTSDVSTLPTGAVVPGSIEIARVSPLGFLRLWFDDLFAEFVDGAPGI